MAPDGEFYVGYQRRAPARLGRFLRALVGGLTIGGLLLGAALAALQSPFDPGVFEFGVAREYTGVVTERPHPVLHVERPGGGWSQLYLVGSGKHGAGPAVAGLDGRRVRLTGSLIYRQGQTMIELAGDGIAALEPAAAAGLPVAVDLGRQTLRGEIVDSKCFLGVMKPGRGKPHRACAARCISGGVPPVLRVESGDGAYRHFLLTGAAGEVVNRQLLALVAEPVEVTGRVVRSGDLLLLEADPAAIRRLAGGGGGG